MSITEQIIMIGAVVLGTVFTRFLPFAVFPSGRPVPKFVQYLGKVLPAAVFGMLVVYCLRDVSVLSGNHAIPELLAIAVVAALHLYKCNMLLSIAGGTAAYMLLVNFVF